MQITVTRKSKGDSRRGYHDTDTTIVFEYDGTTYNGKEREKQIVDAIIGGQWMWYIYRVEEEIQGEVTSKDYRGKEVKRTCKMGAKYVVNHGYDSGD